MMMFKTFTVALAIVALTGSNASAVADGTPPVITQAPTKTSRLPLIPLPAQRGPLLARNNAQDAGLVTIANNFTQYANSPYWGWQGYAIFGPKASGTVGGTQWLATAFTPKTDQVATKVEVAALYISGTNGVVVSVDNDASGLPGTPIHTWQVTNLPRVACCTVVGGSDAHGIPLHAGKQYWIVVGTNAKDADTLAIWGFTEFADVQIHGSSFAIYCQGADCNGGWNPGWNPISNSTYGLAFSVLGE